MFISIELTEEERKQAEAYAKMRSLSLEGAFKEALFERIEDEYDLDLVSCSLVSMSKRYGFVYVDADDEGNGTYERYPKDSFWWYKKVIASNGEDLD